MIEVIENRSEEFERFNAEHERGTVFQSALWGEVKSAWRWKAVLVRREGEIRAAMAVLGRKVPGTPWTLFYAPRGPVCDVHDAGLLTELTEGVRRLAAKERAYVLKLDPDVSEEDGRFRALMEGLGYRLAPTSDGFGALQPQQVARLSLEGKTREEILAGMQQKTRYNLRLAERRGVEVRVCTEQALEEFSSLMRITGQRDGFVVRPKAYFEGLLRALGSHARLYMAYAEGEAIAGAIAVQYGAKTWYLYGASGNDKREKMPNYLLQWRMIEWALDSGCALYDFRGISDEPSEQGLWRFKRGFGAERVRFVGEYELVFRPFADAVLRRGLPLAREAALKWAGYRSSTKI